MCRYGFFVLACAALACKPKPAADPPADAPTSSPQTAAPARVPADALGIPVCDRYLADMSTCIESVPEDARPQLREALASAKTSWREAVDAGKRDLVVDACYDARDEGEEILGEIGCAFTHVDDPPRVGAPPATPTKAKAQPLIGIPECDEYILAYTKCIHDKVPQSARGPMQDAMDATVKAWSEAAETNRDGLAKACRAALEAAAVATEQLGCEWPKLH
ncbi:MAG TPA: hypothetical protein VG755_18470 [Nannocystaceae bacterium]|nr:hypothetical protein [Nannocystaceae bacterium]